MRAPANVKGKWNLYSKFENLIIQLQESRGEPTREENTKMEP